MKARVGRGLLTLVSLMTASACGSAPTPQSTLAAYRSALDRGDVQTVRDLSDRRFQSAWDSGELSRWAAKNPRLLTEASSRLGRPAADRAPTLIVPLEDGEVRLVWEDERWRVASGGWLLARFDTPEAALRTFFFAATGHLGLLRKCLPEADAQRLASDHALGKELYARRARIFRARDALGPITDGRAQVEGNTATLRYAEGKTVRMILEAERWRVVDVE